MNAKRFIRAASQKHGVSVSEILGRSKRDHIVKARWCAWSMARGAGWSLPMIGDAFGRHHTTIMYGLREYERGGL